MTQVNRQWLLARRPKGVVSAEDFRWNEASVPEPGEGEALVRNLYLSCDPTQRGWMAGDTYLPAATLGEPMRSFAVGEVVRSRDPSIAEGQLVQGLFGWQDFTLARAGSPSQARPLPPGVPVENAMSALGLTGLTAWFGLTEVGRPSAGETVLVSGAAGATGSMACQIARLLGCKVVGVAGGPEKCRWLTETLHVEAIDYREGHLPARLRRACPDGIDVFFDNVGGPVLEAALDNLALRGRVVLCGAISRYSDEAPSPGPRNYSNLIVKRGRMEGFIVLDHFARAGEAAAKLGAWLAAGELVDRVDVVQGLENAPAALRRLFEGQNQGKQLVKVADRGA